MYMESDGISKVMSSITHCCVTRRERVKQEQNLQIDDTKKQHEYSNAFKCNKCFHYSNAVEYKYCIQILRYYRERVK